MDIWIEKQKKIGTEIDGQTDRHIEDLNLNWNVKDEQEWAMQKMTLEIEET